MTIDQHDDGPDPENVEDASVPAGNLTPDSEPDLTLADDTSTDESTGVEDEAIPPWPTEQYGPEWRMWPPSSKMQIVLIAVAFGIFNCILIGIWAVVMVNNN